MNKQEILERSARHLMTMSARATNEAGKCVYDKSYNGGCAVGVLLSGKSEEFAKGSYADVHVLLRGLINEGLSCPVVNCGNIDLLVSLQGVHDNEAYWSPEGLNDEGLTMLWCISKRVPRGTDIFRKLDKELNQ